MKIFFFYNWKAQLNQIHQLNKIHLCVLNTTNSSKKLKIEYYYLKKLLLKMFVFKSLNFNKN